ncbi:MAG: M20/M25/M40 family metallo-hydrolase [Candidatus Hodarchaeota archaeon]
MDLDKESKQLAIEAKKLIEDVCEVAWTRLPGSEGEKKAQEFLREKMKELGAEEVNVRNFKVYSRFFRWWPEISIYLFLISLVAYLFIPLVALALSALAVANIFFKLFSYTFLDVLFKANPSSNVVGKLKVKDVPKRVLILGGHTDSNYEYPLVGKYGSGFIKYLIPIFGLLVIWILTALLRFIDTVIAHGIIGDINVVAWGVFTNPAWYDWLYFAQFFGLPYVLYLGFNVVTSKPVCGANDNLSGVSVTLQILNYFHKHPDERPNNVELWFTCFGSEEGGMMGSKAMAKDVRNALDDGTFPAKSVWVINFDSVAATGPLHIATSEPLYRCKYLPDVYTALGKSAEKAGVEYFSKSLAAGTDSAPFGRLEIPGTGVLCFGEGPSPAHWHTLDDIPENLDITGIINCIKLGIQFVKDVDESLK